MGPGAIDDEYSDVVRLVLDRTELKKLQTWTSYTVAGVSSYNLGGGAGFIPLEKVSFVPAADSVATVSHLYFYRACYCFFAGSGSQNWKGTISFTRISDTEVAGRLTVTMDATVPAAGDNTDNFQITFGFNQKL